MVECIVCFDEFTSDGRNVPYTIDCGHSICHECWSRRNISMRCPTCRERCSDAKKNYALISLIDSLARPKTTTVCVDCKNDFYFVKEKMMICLTCSTKEEANWMENPDAEEKCLNHCLCGFCVLNAHSTADHSVKGLSELQNILAANRCSELLTLNVGNFYAEVQSCINGDNDIVHLFKQTIEEAISYLKNSKRRDDLFITRDDITDAIDRAQHCLDKILGTHRVGMNIIKKTALDIKGRLPDEYLFENKEFSLAKQAKENEEAFIKVPKILNTITPINEEFLVAQLLNLNVSSNEQLLHSSIRTIIKKIIETVEEPEFDLQTKLYARLCKAQINADLQQTSKSPFNDLLLEVLKKDFCGTFSNEEQTLMTSIKNGSRQVVQKNKKKLWEIFLRKRTRMLAVMRFITELFILKVVSRKWITDFVEQRLKRNSASAPFSKREENSILSVCECLDVIRSSEWHRDEKMEYNKFIAHLKQMKDVVSKSTRYAVNKLVEEWELEVENHGNYSTEEPGDDFE